MKKFITDEDQTQAIKSLIRLVNTPSYLQVAAPGAPFGLAIKQGLVDCLALCEEEGLTTYLDPDGYYGYAEIGSGAETFGILCHLDVVPAGDESLWQTPAFNGTLTETAIIGRGTQDDKGPTIAALYAVKAILKSGASLNKKIRFIFGTDEENLWRCMEQYAAKEEPVSFGIAPDAQFPLIYAEKGLLQVKLKGIGSQEFSFHGGSALNVVPDQATYRGEKLTEVANILAELNYPYTLTSEEIIVKGQAIHAKDAPKGINANTRLAEALCHVYSHPGLDFLGKLVKNDAHGTSIFGDVSDQASGKLTFNLGAVEINSTGTTIGIDMRMPVTVKKEEIVQRLTTVASQYALTYHQHDYLAPLYVAEDSALVTTLLSAYQDVTGDFTPPKISGGATYARTMENCVAFGAMFAETKDTMHQPNEQWSLAEMRKTMEIYAEAIYRLCC